jgi:hypothetical protein
VDDPRRLAWAIAGVVVAVTIGAVVMTSGAPAGAGGQGITASRHLADRAEAHRHRAVCLPLDSTIRPLITLLPALVTEAVRPDGLRGTLGRRRSRSERGQQHAQTTFL